MCCCLLHITEYVTHTCIHIVKTKHTLPPAEFKGFSWITCLEWFLPHLLAVAPEPHGGGISRVIIGHQHSALKQQSHGPGIWRRLRLNNPSGWEREEPGTREWRAWTQARVFIRMLRMKVFAWDAVECGSWELRRCCPAEIYHEPQCNYTFSSSHSKGVGGTEASLILILYSI